MKTEEICFGLDPEQDKRSLLMFIQKFANPTLLETLVPRLQEQEITAVLDLLSSLMRQHMSDKEYHQLFLKE